MDRRLKGACLVLFALTFGVTWLSLLYRYRPDAQSRDDTTSPQVLFFYAYLYGTS